MTALDKSVFDALDYMPFGEQVADAPPGYSFCASENGTCTFTGTQNVAYGADGVFTYNNGVTGGSIPCNNATFGDPCVGYVKSCWVTGGSQTGGGNSTPHKFAGYERDPETGNDYASARFYGSREGSFFSPDPIRGDPSSPQTLNRYAYVRNNPINLTDPSGLCDNFDGTCGDGGISIGFDWGWWGSANSGAGPGPDGPQNFPANIGPNPNPSNGTLTSDDPFSGETNGIPNGLQIPTRDLAGMLGIEMPNPWILSVVGGHFSVDVFAKFLYCNAAGSVSTGFCVIYVRQALKEAGLKTAGHPELPKDYGPFLAGQGCTQVSPTPAPDYTPQKGDIAVLQPVPGRASQAGHIEGWDGTQWISDFRQGAKDLYPGSVYRNAKVPYAVYRCN